MSKNKVRIGIDQTKASPFLIEVLVDGKWTEKYRKSKKKQAQEMIDKFFVNNEQEPDFDYGKTED